ncbi:glycosyl hydrolase family 18 protein, partial [Pantoea endophytica]
EHYVKLIKKLKETLKDTPHKNLKISIAISAVPDVMALSNLPALIEAGVTGLNVMTYDFFGTGWADHVTHHSALKPTGRDYPPIGGDIPQAVSSVETAVDYLVDELKIDRSMIFVGYAGYSRNAIVDSLVKVSPLEAEYEKSATQDVMGTFERGTTEWYDLIYNYFDLEDPKTTKGSKNGFKLYTDTVANADFLYNAENKLFMSLDTPRSVKAKGEYVLEKNLGGLFTWTIDNDNGVLVNAAREGLGYTITNEVVDMSEMYFEGDTGEDITPPVTFDPPRNLTFVSATADSATVSFDKPSSVPEGYTVVYQPYAMVLNSGKIHKLNPISTGSRADYIQKLYINLKPETKYQAWLQAVYKKNGSPDKESEPSNLIEFTTDSADLPEEPTNWQKGIAYKTGDLVNYSGKVWEAIASHVSSTANRPQAGATFWKEYTVSDAIRSLVSSSLGKKVTLVLKGTTVHGDPSSVAKLIKLLKLN